MKAMSCFVIAPIEALQPLLKGHYSAAQAEIQ